MIEPQWTFQVDWFKDDGDLATSAHKPSLGERNGLAFGVLLGAGHTGSKNVSSSIPRIEKDTPASTHNCTDFDREKVQLSDEIHKCFLCSSDHMYNGKGLRAHLKQHWFESHMFNQEPCLCCSQYHTRKQTNRSLAAHWSVHPTSCPLSRWFEGKTRGITSLNIQPTLSMHNRQSSVYGMWHSIRLITPTDNLIKVVSPQTCMYYEDITCLPDTTCP